MPLGTVINSMQLLIYTDFILGIAPFSIIMSSKQATFFFLTNKGIQISSTIWLFSQVYVVSLSLIHQVIIRKNPMKVALRC